jgi:hypothetical protein
VQEFLELKRGFLFVTTIPLLDSPGNSIVSFSRCDERVIGPARFYETLVSPAFTGTDGIVYVLPETRPARDVFGSCDVQGRAGRHNAGAPPRGAQAANSAAKP